VGDEKRMNGIIDKGALIKAMKERKQNNQVLDSGFNELNHWLREIQQGTYNMERFV
jgi:hypothetical protein